MSGQLHTPIALPPG